MKGIKETENTIHIDIDKPVYKSYVGIRDIYLKKNKLLIIRAGKIEEDKYKFECKVRPIEWKKEANKKSVVGFYKDDPMIMYFNHVAKFKKQEEPEVVANVMEQLASMPEKYRLQIKAKLGLH